MNLPPEHACRGDGVEESDIEFYGTLSKEHRDVIAQWFIDHPREEEKVA